MEKKERSDSMSGKFLFPDREKIANRNKLEYFISLLEAGAKDRFGDSAEHWDRRAERWEKEKSGGGKGEERVESAVTYLEQKGLLQSNHAVADIGCGPGRFAAAFAKRVDRVVGLDISEKMILHGREYLQKEGVENAALYVRSFQTLDLEKEGWVEAFDLVFSSLTPAVSSAESLVKAMRMSRGWCCTITHLSRRNFLQEQIMREVFGSSVSPQWDGSWFYALFNALFLLGYDPETSYTQRHREVWVRPDEAYAEHLMEQILPGQELTMSNAEKIRGWLLEHQNEEGVVLEVTDASYGRILWDVRKRTARPEYG